MIFRDLRANEIDARVGQVGDGYCTLLLYKDARVDMDILDETVGAMNWQREHYEVKGNLFCRVGIFGASDSEPCRWVFKADCGTESNTEKEKGESSDSFKRACVNWGIGRELYTAPLIKVNCKTKDKKVQDLTSFSVADIVIENKAITGLQIKAYDKENKTTDIVFSWGKLKGEKKEEKKAPKQDKPFKTEEPKKMTLEEARQMGFTSNGKEYVVATMTDEQLLAMKDYTKMPRLAEGCAMELAERAKAKVENENHD
jgi:hypothetical protein